MGGKQIYLKLVLLRLRKLVLVAVVMLLPPQLRHEPIVKAVAEV